MPPAGAPCAAAPGSAAKGRLTTLPPRGRPVAPEMGRSPERSRLGRVGGVPLLTPIGLLINVVPDTLPGLNATPVLAAVWKPWPMIAVWLLMLPAPAPPHWTPMPS